MARCNILIVDEFVRTDKEIIQRVFVPFLTSVRTPAYMDLSPKERSELPEEANKQLYLSSIRGADEWSYQYFLEYIKNMEQDNMSYMTVALPYQLGVKNRYISRDIVEQSFKDNPESRDILCAEYLCLPERNNNNAFYKYRELEKRRENVRAMVCMSDE